MKKRNICMNLILWVLQVILATQNFLRLNGIHQSLNYYSLGTRIRSASVKINQFVDCFIYSFPMKFLTFQLIAQ